MVAKAQIVPLPQSHLKRNSLPCVVKFRGEVEGNFISDWKKGQVTMRHLLTNSKHPLSKVQHSSRSVRRGWQNADGFSWIETPFVPVKLVVGGSPCQFLVKRRGD